MITSIISGDLGPIDVQVNTCDENKGSRQRMAYTNNFYML